MGWLEFRGVVEGRSAEPTEQDVAAARGRGDDGLVVHLVFGTFAIAVGLRSSVLGFLSIRFSGTHTECRTCEFFSEFAGECGESLAAFDVGHRVGSRHGQRPDRVSVPA